MGKIKLKSITCHQPSETDKDEIFLKYQGKKIWPESSKFMRIDTNETLSINLTIDATTIWMEIELWEYNYLSRNDLLGDFVFKSSNYAGEYTNDLKVTEEFIYKVKYSLLWELIR